MAISVRAIMAFFVEFERAITQMATPGVMECRQRDPMALLKLFRTYSNCEFETQQLDFTQGIDVDAQDAANPSAQVDKPAEIWSLVLNFGTRAEIWVNDRVKLDGKKLVNRCHRRFLVMKEAFHVILRDELIRNGSGHPDTGRPEKLVTLTEELIYLPFSIIDFDSPEYSDSVKVEHAAELLAFLMLYPFDSLSVDRASFLNGDSTGVGRFDKPEVIIASTLDFATEYLVPRRYVDLLFRWHRFNQLYVVYRQLRDRYTA
ncbi:MAG: hypothetical protein KIT25_05145 [Enhydrobacter sp.]|nr:MAG: hypothetical protein KIT25_05145 [Enhydrobacter sp.]